MRHFTHGYTRLTGRDAVESVRRNAGNCTSFKVPITAGEVEYTFAETFDVGGPAAGTDASYARCDRVTFPSGSTGAYCDTYVAKGPLMAHVSVSYGDVPKSRAKLLQVVPTAVAALLAV